MHYIFGIFNQGKIIF